MSERHFPRQSQGDQPGDEHAMHPEPQFIDASYRPADKLEGRRAIISGGDSGIGRAVAVHYAAEGADVLFTYLDEHEDAAETVRLVEQYGGQCESIAGDMGDSAFCQSAVDRAIELWGGLNIVVNNAAEQYDWRDVTQISDAQLHRTFATNIFSHFYMARAALPYMGEGDVLIATSSINAFKGNDTLIDYSATKGAVQGLMRSLAQSLVDRGIRVNAVAPGPVWTPLIPASFDADKTAHFGGQVPMNRAAQPSEIAPAYVYLACRESSYMTGQTIHLNGGVILNT